MEKFNNKEQKVIGEKTFGIYKTKLQNNFTKKNKTKIKVRSKTNPNKKLQKNI